MIREAREDIFRASRDVTPKGDASSRTKILFEIGTSSRLIEKDKRFALSYLDPTQGLKQVEDKMSKHRGALSLSVTLVVAGCVSSDNESPRQRFALDRALDASFEIDAPTHEDAGTPVEREGRGEPHAEPASTREQLEARASLDRRLSEIERSAGRELPEAWSAATADEMHEVAQLVRRAAAPGAVDAWREHLDTEIATDRSIGGVVPTNDQVEALSVLASRSVAMFDTQWDFANGTPARLEQVGYVARDVGPVEAWAAFLNARREQMAALFGSAFFGDTEMVAVESSGEFELLHLLRRHDGLQVSHDHVDVYVTNRTSVLGAGVVWRIVVRWNPLASSALERLRATRLLTEVEARHVVGGEPVSAKLSVTCGEECTATWVVLRNFQDEVLVDASTGEIRGHHDPRANSTGTVYQRGLPPGTGAVGASIRFRGARITNGTGTEIGASNAGDGTYSISGYANPWTIDMQGGRSAVGGAWTLGRVDRRSMSNVNTVVISPVLWNVSSELNRNFGSPDGWPAQASTLRHGASIVYGWYAYWQNLFKTSLTVQVPDTNSFALGGAPASELHAGSALASDGGAPGSGQSTWGQSYLYWNDDDSEPAAPDDQLSIFAHEFAHTIQYCAATAGPGCARWDPAHGSFRPADATQWRRRVWGCFGENFPDFFGAALSDFRSCANGGYDCFESNWRYGGYFDTTDDFGDEAEQSANQTNCPDTPCPSGFVATMPTAYSPYDQFELGSCICSKTCSTNADCMDARLYCGSDGLCGADDHQNKWFSTVGTRLVFDVGWLPAMRMMVLAAAGASDNGMRDFNRGTDTWYAKLADQGINVAAVTRAVRSATNEPNVISRDDYADSREEALPIPVLSTTGTYLNWGSGTGYYPQLDSVLDTDWFLFRGVYNSSYTVSAAPLGGSTADLSATVYRLSDFAFVASSSLPTGQSVELTTPGLPSNAWYAVKISNRVASFGRYTARVKLASLASDEFPSVTAEAYPLPSGVAQNGYLNVGDVDRFQIFVPTTLTSLAVVTASSPAAVVEIFSPTGTTLGAAYGSMTLSAATIASVGGGYYTFDVREAAGVARAYSVTASLSCATWLSSSCDDLSSTALTVRNSWGDRFAGRLPTASSTASYATTLTANESVSVGLVADSSACRFSVELYPPTQLSYFNGGPVFRWTDDTQSGLGTGSSDEAGTRGGVGGHFFAPQAGTYRLQVRQTAGSSCTYRLNVSRSGLATTPRPTW